MPTSWHHFILNLFFHFIYLFRSILKSLLLVFFILFIFILQYFEKRYINLTYYYYSFSLHQKDNDTASLMWCTPKQYILFAEGWYSSSFKTTVQIYTATANDNKNKSSSSLDLQVCWDAIRKTCANCRQWVSRLQLDFNNCSLYSMLPLTLKKFKFFFKTLTFFYTKYWKTVILCVYCSKGQIPKEK